MTEDEMVGWHHRLNGHEFDLTPQDGEGHRHLTCYSPWGHKESDMTQQLNNNLIGIIETQLFSQTGQIAALYLDLLGYSACNRGTVDNQLNRAPGTQPSWIVPSDTRNSISSMLHVKKDQSLLLLENSSYRKNV